MSGEVSLTCDTWQASNSDAYFAMTGHWIEKVSPSVMKEHAALFRFTQMNTAHNGACLRCTLYKIAKRLEITHKVRALTIFLTHMYVDVDI